MATFKYAAKDMTSKVQYGTMDADDRNELVRKLKDQGLYLVEYKDITKQAMNQYRLKYKSLQIIQEKLEPCLLLVYL